VVWCKAGGDAHWLGFDPARRVYYLVGMHGLLRTIIVLLGALFALQGVGWLLAPSVLAGSLGMPLLDGLGRSTQVGDFASFFLTAGVCMVVGTRPGRAKVLYFPAALIGGAAVTRTIAWMMQGADFAAVFIAVELVTGALLYRGATVLDRS
jgi:hypothetical protein